MREKKVVGRKRHVVVDTLGLLWSLVITPASVQDRDGGCLALAEFRRHVKFPRVIWADSAYRRTATWAWIQWAVRALCQYCRVVRISNRSNRNRFRPGMTPPTRGRQPAPRKAANERYPTSRRRGQP
ncbi:MAG: transposase [Pirellulales bacterium]